MRALDKMLLRDFRKLAAQALAIALVLGCGVAVLLTSFGMHRALDATRAAYYERNEFADVFAQARRAPLSLMSEIRAIDGVWAAEPRIVGEAVLDLPNRARTAHGRFISLPASGGLPNLNIPVLREGRLPDPAATDEVLVNQPFATANGFSIGDSFQANLNGAMRRLTITGTALSPEFIYTLGPGALMPDNAGYGIVWMPEAAVAAAFDMSGAFDDVTLKLSRGASEAQVIDSLDRLLEPYGGLGAYGRDQQQSNAFIDAEIKQLRNMSYVLPPIFLAITIFLVNMVITRIVALERAEIGLLKAIGYSNAEVSLHYILLAVLVAVVGVMIGWSLGTWLSRNLARMYAEFFDFPFLIFSTSLDAYAISGVLGIAAAALGALRSALRAANLPPAVAMNPPAPPHYRRGLADRALALIRPSQPTMMIARSIIRWPVRSALTSLGLALAVSILVASSYFTDALDKIIETAFFQTYRQDAILIFANELPESVIDDVRKLPGVLQAEGQQFQSVELRHGPRRKRVGLEVRRPGTDLSRVVDAVGRVVTPPREGILLSDRMAQILGARPGDSIEVRFLTGRKESHLVTVSGLVTQYFGLGAYMDFDYVNGLFRQGPRVSAVNVTVDDNRLDDFHAALKGLPKLSGTVMLTDSRLSFQRTLRENVNIMTTVYVVIAIVITVGVAYNSARIQLSERARELASLRILGFTQGEVSYILMGETLTLAILAQPLGWALGAWISAISSRGFQSDLYTIPLVYERDNFGTATLVVLAAATLSALLVRRRLAHLDLVAVMKTRE